jgi:hypothetical protein
VRDVHGNGNTQEVMLLQLRATALREPVACGQANPGDHTELTRTLYGLTHVPNSGVTGRDVLDAARLAHGAAPDDPEALEVLVLGLLVAGNTSELVDTLRELELRAPHSKVLAILRDAHTDPARHDISAARMQHMRDIGRRALNGDRAAEAELRLEAQEFPRNHQYRVDLIFAVYNRGDHAEARQLRPGGTPRGLPGRNIWQAQSHHRGTEPGREHALLANTAHATPPPASTDTITVMPSEAPSSAANWNAPVTDAVSPSGMRSGVQASTLGPSTDSTAARSWSPSGPRGRDNETARTSSGRTVQ